MLQPVARKPSNCRAPVHHSVQLKPAKAHWDCVQQMHLLPLNPHLCKCPVLRNGQASRVKESTHRFGVYLLLFFPVSIRMITYLLGQMSKETKIAYLKKKKKKER